MANTSQNKQGKALRIGVIQNGKVTDEVMFREHRSISVGYDLKNQIVLGADGGPESFVVFEKSGDGYRLKLDASMRAQLTIDDSTIDLASGGEHQLDLNSGVQGRVVIGEAVLLFQFVDAPPLAAIPPLPKAMQAGPFYVLTVGFGLSVALVVSFFLSGILHGVFVGMGYVIPPPPRDDGSLQLSARLTRMIVEAPPEEEQEIPDLPEDPDNMIVEDDSLIADTSATDSSSSETESSSGRGGAAGGDSSGALTGIDQVVAGSAFGALMNADGGLNLGLADASSASERSAAEALASQQASGATGAGGVVAENLGSIGSGTGDGSGRIGIGGDGSSSVAEAAQAGGATTAQEQVRVRANVGDRGQRMAGSGQLSESEVRGVLGRFQRRVERCYERTLASNPSASGRVELQFRVDDSGQTADARMPTNELGDTFGNCILTEVRRLRFSPPSGGAVTVSQRYILQPGR